MKFVKSSYSTDGGPDEPTTPIFAESYGSLVGMSSHGPSNISQSVQKVMDTSISHTDLEVTKRLQTYAEILKNVQEEEPTVTIEHSEVRNYVKNYIPQDYRDIRPDNRGFELYASDDLTENRDVVGATHMITPEDVIVSAQLPVRINVDNLPPPISGHLSSSGTIPELTVLRESQIQTKFSGKKVGQPGATWQVLVNSSNSKMKHQVFVENNTEHIPNYSRTLLDANLVANFVSGICCVTLCALVESKGDEKFQGCKYFVLAFGIINLIYCVQMGILSTNLHELKSVSFAIYTNLVMLIVMGIILLGMLYKLGGTIPSVTIAVVLTANGIGIFVQYILYDQFSLELIHLTQLKEDAEGPV